MTDHLFGELNISSGAIVVLSLRDVSPKVPRRKGLTEHVLQDLDDIFKYLLFEYSILFIS